MDEKLQIRKILKGDISSFAYFVDTYQHMAVTIAYRVCRNKQDAEDIVQNAFVKAFHNLHTFRLESKFSTWFYRIVYNTAMTEKKRKVYYTEFIDDNTTNTDNLYSDLDIITQIETKERVEIINKVFEKMPEDESVLLTLYYIEGIKIKDIALITNLTETNVKVKLYRARKRFGEIIHQQINI